MCYESINANRSIPLTFTECSFKRVHCDAIALISSTQGWLSSDVTSWLVPPNVMNNRCISGAWARSSEITECNEKSWKCALCSSLAEVPGNGMIPKTCFCHDLPAGLLYDKGRYVHDRTKYSEMVEDLIQCSPHRTSFQKIETFRCPTTSKGAGAEILHKCSFPCNKGCISWFAAVACVLSFIPSCVLNLVLM